MNISLEVDTGSEGRERVNMACLKRYLIPCLTVNVRQQNGGYSYD
ncbi:hypothetical protein SAMN04488136_104126 [Vibrio xiamenensis]|uniref:Uncharacterized protein n=1 Tax=Vibrio xiamenensis TaxID=861298 RepID=A0A1G7XZG2_9VIBR|nr:hypothetical protein SAMN04488136_104126 [Vibrio xiamenensis]